MFQTSEFITPPLFVPWEVQPVRWLSSVEEQTTKMLLRTLGVSEDTEMEDGIGSKPLINRTEKSHWLDINILPFSLEL